MGFSSLNPFSASADTAQPKTLFDLKKEALQLAQTQAGGKQFTLDDYLETFQNLAKDSPLIDEKTRNDPNKIAHIAADLSHQTLDHVLISEAKHHRIPAFYDNLNFKDAVITHSLVDPADSFNTHLKAAQSISDTEFRNLDDRHNLVLGHGEYHDLTFTNFTGGNVTFSGSHVQTLNMEGAHITHLHLTHDAALTGINANNAHFVQLNGEPGTSISHSNFCGVTITSNSNMQGMVLVGDDFSGASMHDVNLKHTKLTGVTLPLDLKGVTLDGAEIRNMKLEDGTPVTSLDKLTALGAHINKDTHFKGGIAQDVTRGVAPAVAPEKAAPAPLPAGLSGIDPSIFDSHRATFSKLSGGDHADYTTITPAQAPTVTGMNDKSGQQSVKSGRGEWSISDMHRLAAEKAAQAQGTKKANA